MIKKINFYMVSVFLAAVFWGIAGIFVRSLEGTLLQMQIVFWRAVISAAVFCLIIIIKDVSLFKIKFKDLWLFISAGLFSIVLFNFSYYTTMSLTSLSVAAVLLYTAPFFVVLMSIFIFKEILTSEKLIACIIAFVGCCFVSGLFDSAQKISGKALFFGLLTGFGYALYTVFGKLLMNRGYKTLTITFYVFLFAALCTLPFINITDTVKNTVYSPKVLLTVFLMAVLNTVIPYILYTTGLKGVEPSVAPIIATVEPVVATLVGCFIFSEDITIFGIIGIVLVLASVIILNTGKITIKANAKINLSLSILGKREDGYHTIDTIMQSVSLCDIIKVSSNKKIKVKCNINDVAEQDNIAYKAAKLFFEETGINAGVLINIKKRIPAAAGLGGGSADAAAVLLALDKIYKTELTKESLQKMALKLGADVPFFIGGGTMRAQGIGEVLSDLPCFNKGWFVLLKEGTKPSTAEMYRKLDETDNCVCDTEKTIKALKNDNLSDLANLFENSFACVWGDSTAKEKLLNLGADGVSLSGSGPTWFAFYYKKADAKRTYKQLKREKSQCYLVKPCDKAIIFE